MLRSVWSGRFCATAQRICVQAGYLVYLIPQKRLESRICAMLSYRFENISAFRFPEKEYRTFRQIVIFGTAKKKPENDPRSLEYLKKVGELPETVPFLPETPDHVYPVPVSPKLNHLLFRSGEIDAHELAEEVILHGLFGRLKELTTPLSLTEKIRPIMPLRHGHLAQILACGLMNGVVWDKDGRSPLLVKGVTRKEVTSTVEQEGEVEKTTETDRIRIVIHAFDSEGELLTIE